jgi:hypothetical protein
MDYSEAFEMGEKFTAVCIQTFGLRSGQNVTDLLAYLGYKVDDKGHLEAVKELLGTLPEGSILD